MTRPPKPQASSNLRVAPRHSAWPAWAWDTRLSPGPRSTLAIWSYGTRESFSNVARLLLICVALFVYFLPVGSSSRRSSARAELIGRLYLADLVGAWLACAVVVRLIASIGPPATIILAG
jgi:hypothetical protein